MTLDFGILPFAWRGQPKGADLITLRRSLSAQNLPNPLTGQFPFQEQAVRGQPSVKRTAGNPIKIWKICSSDTTQPIQIEMSVARLQRIECPLNDGNISGKSILALRQLELAANAEVLIFGQNSYPVRVQPAERNGRERESKANHALLIKSAQHLADETRGYREDSAGINFEIGISPNRLLQGHGGLQVGLTPKRPDIDSELYSGFHKWNKCCIVEQPSGPYWNSRTAPLGCQTASVRGGLAIIQLTCFEVLGQTVATHTRTAVQHPLLGPSSFSTGILLFLGAKPD
jgi:hypothetical protein